MQVGSRADVVGKVVDDEAGAVGRQGHVQLAEQGDDRGGGGLAAGEGDEDVAVGVEELDEQLGRQAGAETLGLGGEEDDVVIGPLAVAEEADGAALRSLEGDGEATAWGVG